MSLWLWQLNVADSAMAFAPLKGFDPLMDVPSNMVTRRYKKSFAPEIERAFAPDLYARSTVEWINWTNNEDLIGSKQFYLWRNQILNDTRESTSPLAANTALKYFGYLSQKVPSWEQNYTLWQHDTYLALPPSVTAFLAQSLIHASPPHLLT